MDAMDILQKKVLGIINNDYNITEKMIESLKSELQSIKRKKKRSPREQAGAWTLNIQVDEGDGLVDGTYDDWEEYMNHLIDNIIVDKLKQQRNYDRSAAKRILGKRKKG